jgi:hypothetical protein
VPVAVCAAFHTAGALTAGWDACFCCRWCSKQVCWIAAPALSTLQLERQRAWQAGFVWGSARQQRHTACMCMHMYRARQQCHRMPHAGPAVHAWHDCCCGRIWISSWLSPVLTKAATATDEAQRDLPSLLLQPLALSSSCPIRCSQNLECGLHCVGHIVRHRQTDGRRYGCFTTACVV